MATEQYKADLAKRRGQVAAGIQDPEAKKKFIARQGEDKTSDVDLEAETHRERNRQALGGDYGLARFGRK